jgi:hypothetical protein
LLFSIPHPSPSPPSLTRARVLATACGATKSSQVSLSANMSKRHNRKRTRSRPRHRDAGKAHSNHSQSLSTDTDFAFSSGVPSPYLTQFPSVKPWPKTYSQQHHRQSHQYHNGRETAMEAQRLRFFGGYSNDEVSLFEPMLKVVTDLFDGNTDYEDP